MRLRSRTRSRNILSSWRPALCSAFARRVSLPSLTGHRDVDLRAPGVMINLPLARSAESEEAASGESRN
jgi:hypothetical protein